MSLALALIGNVVANWSSPGGTVIVWSAKEDLGQLKGIEVEIGVEHISDDDLLCRCCGVRLILETDGVVEQSIGCDESTIAVPGRGEFVIGVVRDDDPRLLEDLIKIWRCGWE